MSITTEQPESATEVDRSIWPNADILRHGGGQLGNWSMKLSLARKSLERAANQLAPRVGRPPLTRGDSGAQADLPLSPLYALDIAHAALVAESALKIGADLDSLTLRVAALEAARKES